MDFAGRRNRNKKNDGREIWREKIKKLSGTRWKEFWKEIFRRELDSWALRGEIGAAQDNHGYACTLLDDHLSRRN